MTVEIRELTIKAVVGSSSSSSSPARSGDASSGGDKETLIAECIERVLEVLERTKER